MRGAIQVAVQGGGDGELERVSTGERVHWSMSCSWKKGDHAGERERERQGRVEDEQVGDDERKKCPCGAIR